MLVTRELRDPHPAERTREPDNLRLQRELKALGHFNGDLDGRFGPKTTEAVQSFARWRNEAEPKPNPPLRTDGVVDAYLGRYLNAQFHVTDVGKLVKDREDALTLKEQRIQELRAALGQGPPADREIELRRRLHRWLERKAEELEHDVFEGIRGYQTAALMPRDVFATDLAAHGPEQREQSQTT